MASGFLRRTALTLAALGGMAAGAAAQRPNPRGGLVPRDTVEALKRIEQEIGQANIRGDKAYFAQLEADEFLLTGANGGVTTRAGDLAGLDAPRTSTIDRYVADSMVVRVYGGTAVVWGRATVSGTRANGTRYTVRSRFTDVFVVRNGRWQLVAGHSSRVPQPATALTAGARVRATVSSIGPGWREGTIAEPAGGCTVITVTAPAAPGGRLRVLLHSIERLQLARLGADGGEQWDDVPMAQLRADDANCARE